MLILLWISLIEFLFWLLFLVSFWKMGFPDGSDGKESAGNAGDPGLIPGLGRCPGERNGYPLQHSYLENSMDRGAGGGGGGLQSMGSQRVEHYWGTNSANSSGKCLMCPTNILSGPHFEVDRSLCCCKNPLAPMLNSSILLLSSKNGNFLSFQKIMIWWLGFSQLQIIFFHTFL